MKHILFFLLFPIICPAQQLIQGKIVEVGTSLVIPFATIGLAKQNTGTNATEQGEFRISCKQPALDSLVVSCVGYTTLRIPLKDFISNSIIALSPNEKRLKAVVVKNKWSYSEVGTYTAYKNHCLISNGFQSQAAKKISAPVANSILTGVKIRLSKNRKGLSMFRIRIYDYDPLKKGPGEELTDSIIQVSAKPGLVSIDMTPYQIELKAKDFFVSLEWLIIPVNENRYLSRYEGEKQDREFLDYRPGICLTKYKRSTADELWALSYSGKWFPMLLDNDNLAISATVKY
jgi:hypothetical protein